MRTRGRGRVWGVAGLVAMFGAIACEQSLDVLSPGPDGSVRGGAMDAGVTRDATDGSDGRGRTDGARVADAEPPDGSVADARRDATGADVDAACLDVPTVQLPGCLACSPACANGGSCGHNHDCASGRCTGATCVPPMCSPECNDMTACGADSDCASGICSEEKCQAPTCAPSCAAGAACGGNVDCLSHHCTKGACM